MPCIRHVLMLVLLAATVAVRGEETVTPSDSDVEEREDSRITLHLVSEPAERREVIRTLADALPSIKGCFAPEMSNETGDGEPQLEQGGLGALNTRAVRKDSLATWDRLLERAREEGLLPEDKALVLARNATDEEPALHEIFLVSREPDFAFDNIETAMARQSPYDEAHWEIIVTLSSAHGEDFGDFTEAHVNRALAIVYEGRVLTAPVVRDRITTGIMITGDFSEAEAREIVAGLDAGNT